MCVMKHSIAPVPTRAGLSPSHVHVPTGHWSSLLAFLCQRFPHIDAAVWRERLAQGQVFDDAGRPFSLDSACPSHARIWYYRAVAQETPVPFSSPVLFRDARLVVADKPHLLACAPAGRHVHETLLTRLRVALDLPDLTPLHRLDRETAGVMLFCTRPAFRAAYQGLFQHHRVCKTYEAIAPFRDDLALPLVRRSRLCEREDSFLMHEVAGEPNSETHVALIERRGEWARYRLSPTTGKKHQLRAHLAALGIGICGDPWYPVRVTERAPDDFSSHLLLLARSIGFVDPFDGSQRRFCSARTLDWPAA